MIGAHPLTILLVKAIATITVNACQSKDTGCSETISCCAGLTCKLSRPSDAFGFCQATSGSATNPGPIKKVLTTKKAVTASPVGNALITKAQFVAALTNNGYPSPTDEQYKNLISRAGPAGKITEKRELAMFLANLLLESDGLKAKAEYNPPAGAYQYPTFDVPGQKYYGRGYLMLSWSYNYRAASLALYNDQRLLTNADQVAKNDTVAWDTAFWFWSANVHSKAGISDGKFGASISAINGALECGAGAVNTVSPKHRFEIYKNVFAAFGLSGSPNEHGCWN